MSGRLHIMGASAILTLALTGVATAEIGASRAQELLDQGAVVLAEGELVESVTCTRHTLRIFYGPQHESCDGRVKYGSFKRLKSANREFVCVSFRDWTCYPSEARN